MAKKTTKTEDINSVILQSLTISQMQRKAEDIATWQSAIKSAENVNNPRRKNLYTIYTNILTDGFLKSLMEKRIRAVKTAPIVVEGEQDNVELENRFRSPWFFKLLGLIMETKFWSHSVIEFIIEEQEIDDVILIPRQHVVPERGIIQLRENSDDGAIPYREPPYNNFLLEVGDYKDLGLLLNCAPYALYKRGNIADYSDFNEMFGQPIRQYTYDPHQPESRAQAEEGAKAAGQAAYIVVPRGTDLTLHQASGISASGTFKDFNRVMNDEMAITVLGQTLTTMTEGKGSNALGRVHQDVEESINMEDKIWIEYVLNWQLKDILIAHGWPLEGKFIRFDDTQKLPPAERYKMYLALNESLPMDPNFIYEDLNIPPPDPAAIEAWKEIQKMKISTRPGGAGDTQGKP